MRRTLCRRTIRTLYRQSGARHYATEHYAAENDPTDPITNIGSILLVLWGQKLGPTFCPDKTSSMLPTFMIGNAFRY